VPLDGVPPFVLVKAYGGSPPPFDQPRLVALLKPKAVVGCEGGGEGGGEGEGGGGEGGGGSLTSETTIEAPTHGQAPRTSVGEQSRVSSAE
jgi:hypothetical protein